MAAIGSRRLADRLANRRLPIAAVARNLRFEFVFVFLFVFICFFFGDRLFFLFAISPNFRELDVPFFFKKIWRPRRWVGGGRGLVGGRSRTPDQWEAGVADRFGV